MAYKIGIGEILAECNKKKYKADKIKFLRSHQDNAILLGTLKMAFDKSVKWLLPEGDVPYKPQDKDFDAQGLFYAEFRRLYLFVEGGHETLKQNRREQLFIDLLENSDCDDAKMVCSMREHKFPWKGITRNLIEDTFPDLLT